MGFLNLTLAQFLAVLIPLSGILVALYFYDRSRRRVKVSTLRFWPRRPAPPVTRRHKKIQQPLSLLLQLIAMLLLLLAIADWRFGLFEGQQRHHVILLDSSSAMGVQAAGRQATLMDVAKAQALGYLQALPGGDPVMLMRVDGTPSPATTFTSNRGELRQAIAETQPGWTAARLEEGLEAARGAVSLALGAEATSNAGLARLSSVGEIAYIGPGVSSREVIEEEMRGFSRLRVIDVGQAADDVGIRRFAARRLADDPTRWQVAIELQNLGPDAQEVAVNFLFEGRKLGERVVNIAGRGSEEFDFRVRTEQRGQLQAVISTADGDARNNAASLSLPASIRQPLAVYTDRPARLRPLLTATPHLEPTFRSPDDEGASRDRLRLYDGVTGELTDGAIYFAWTADNSPIPAKQIRGRRKITSWDTTHPLGSGLREGDAAVTRSLAFEVGENDSVIASTSDGPVVIAHSDGEKRYVVVGFDPTSQSLANRLLTPLLFANAVRWFAPDVFRLSEYRAEAPGSVSIDVGSAASNQIQVRRVSGGEPAWVLEQGRVRLFAPQPGVTRVSTPLQSSRLSLSLPEAGVERWTPDASVLKGLPPPSGVSLAGVRLWPWLALAALALLAIDWRLFGRGSRTVATGDASRGSASFLNLANRATGDEAR